MVCLVFVVVVMLGNCDGLGAILVSNLVVVVV